MRKPKSGKAVTQSRARSAARGNLLRLQRDLLQALGSTQDLQTGLKRCLRAAIEASGMDGGGIYLVDDASGGLELSYQEGCPADFVKATSRFDAAAPQTRLVLAGRSVYTEYSHLGLPRRKATALSGIRSIAVIPFRHRRRVIGCLNIASFTRDSILPAEKEALETVAAAIGGVVSRLRTETALKQSEEGYRTLLESSSDSIFVIDDDWRLTVINRAVLRFLGRKREEVIGRSLLELMPEIRTWPEFKKLGAILKKRRRATVSGEYRLRDGRHGWYEVRLDPSPGGMLCVLRDISAAKQAETAVKESEVRFRMMADQAPIMIGLGNMTGNIVFLNKTWLEFRGKTLKEEADWTWTADIHPDERERVVTGIAEAVRTRDPCSVEFRIKNRRGQYRWLTFSVLPMKNARNEPEGFIGIALDMTVNKTATETLARSEKRFRALIENSSDAISLLAPDGTVLYDGPSYQKIMGYAAGEREGRNTMGLIHPEDQAVIGRLLAGISKARTPIGLPPIRVRHANGGWRWIEGVAQNLLAEPSVGAIVVNFRDISERKKAEEALIESESRFRDLADLLPQMLFEMDLQGRVTYMNHKGVDIAGYSLAEMQGNHDFLSTVDPEEREQVTRTFKQILSGAKNEGIPFTIHRRDGSAFPVVTYAAPIIVHKEIRGLRGLIVDMTAQKAMERELAQTKAILEQAIAQTPIPMVLATAPDNVIRMVNTAALDLLGVRNGPVLVGAAVPGLTPSWREVDRQGAVKNVTDMPLALALRGIETKNVLYAVHRSDDTTRWELVSGSPIRDQSGSIIAAFAVFPDVTETIIAEEELKQRLAVEQLAAEVSADFVNLYSDKIDAGITRALKRIAEFAHSGCATLSLFSEDQATVTNTHEWAFNAAASQFNRFPRNHLGLYEHYLPALRQNRTVAVSRSSEYPERMIQEPHFSSEQGFRSFLFTPLFRSGKLFGLLGLFGDIDHEQPWSFHLVTLIGFIGDMIITLLDRKQSETELQLYREHLEELVGQRTEELERSRQAAINLMETATVQRRRTEDALAESTRMAEALTESQTRLRLATKSAEIGIVETDLASGEVLWDDTCAKIHGFPPERPVRLGEYQLELVHPEDQASLKTSLAEALASATGHWGREYRIVRPGGEVRWITEDHFIFRDAAGVAVRMIGAKQDVTARNRAEEQIKLALSEKETLLREIHHRVKNNLNTISNLIYFQAKLIKDKEAIAAFRDSQNRIQSMARIHEHLYRSWDLSTVDMKAYLSDLVVELAQTYGVKNARIVLACEGIALDIDLAVPCGLIMSELISNALKYAFALDAPDNRIGIRLTEAQPGFTLEVEDNGRGLPPGWDTNSERTLGLRLVTMFCKQLAGTLAVHNAPTGGAVFRIDFPGARQGKDR